MTTRVNSICMLTHSNFPLANANFFNRLLAHLVLSPSVSIFSLNSTSALPEPTYEGKIPITAWPKPFSTQERGLLGSDCEIHF